MGFVDMGAGRPEAEFHNYWAFNKAVNACFFDGRYAGAPVYLDLEETFQDEIAAKLGCAVEEVEKLAGMAVAPTLELEGGDPYALHLGWLKRWERRGRREAPPFTGLLCVLSLAAERMRADEQFSRNNYYQRLVEVLGLEASQARNKLMFHAKSTRAFWRALNLWLGEQDFELGRPTARQVNNWKYASYAISQALVREGDRRNFYKLFEKLGLAPGDDVAEGEMALYLHEWMATTGPSPWLRKIWNVTDLRERVIAAALSELEAWTGAAVAGDGEAGTPRGRLGWVAAISTFPRRRFALSLCAPALEAVSIGGLRLSASSSPTARTAFENCDGDLVLSALGTGEFLALGPAERIGLGPLMLASFELEAEDSTRRFVHAPKPVIPMVKSDSGPFYREAARVSLLKEHLVLCHENWASRVAGFLQKYASPGFARLDASQLTGIPEGWTLFRDVVVTATPNEASDQLAVLVPIAGGASIQLSGGLRLGTGIWHTEAPPSASAAVEDGAFNLAIEREGLDDEAEKVSVSSTGQAVSLELDGLQERDGGNFRAVVLQGKNEKAEKAISFRSATMPRPASVESLCHEFQRAGARWALSATRIEVTTGEVLQGLQVPGSLSVESNGWSTPSFQLATFEAGSGADQEEEVAPAFKPEAFDGAAESCVIRGYHYWIVEPFLKGDNKYESKRMQCRDCGMSTMSRRKLKGGKAPAAQIRRFGAEGLEISPTRREHTATVSPDLVLDALCYLGRGSWTTFQGLAAACRDELWYPASLARLLVELGHIDLEIDFATMRPARWQVAPPALVENAAGDTWFLAGFRSPELVNAVADALEAMDCEYVPPTEDGSVSVHAWRCNSAEAVAGALGGIADPLGREVAVVSGANERLSSALPGLSELRETLPSVHMEAPPDLQVFDLGSGKWRHVDGSRASGAYRSSYGACRHFHRAADGSARAGTAELVKALAAREAMVALHAYDAASGTFSAVMGCEPPGLFARALVACSGRKPVREGGRIIFNDVPPQVGNTILSKLYGRSQ